jgi:hypothetical protein
MQSSFPKYIFLAVVLLASMSAFAKGSDNDLQNGSQISSIRDLLSRSGNRPLHILYVHGIGATGADGSRDFRKSICRVLRDCTAPAAPVARDYADSGPYERDANPPAFAYMGEPVWANNEEWRAAAPFVDHYVLQRTDGPAIVLDEINWWPLVFAVKCRQLVRGEAELAGPDEALLKICSRDKKKDVLHEGRFKSFPWIHPEDAKQLNGLPAKGALINRKLKNNILDWGFSDAVMAVGSMHNLFLEGIRQLFLDSAEFQADGSKSNDWEEQLKNPQGIDRDFIVVSHSLGSYLVFSTLNLDGKHAALRQTESRAIREDDAAQYIFQRTSLVYFFANQVPLLELANLGESETRDADLPKTARPDATQGLSDQLSKWSQLRLSFGGSQLIAWSDPSDLLTWHVPQIHGLVVKNFDVRNTRWHWIIAGPESAHDNYDKNKNVLTVMFGHRPPTKANLAANQHE